MSVAASIIRSYLRNHGISDHGEVEQILGGFDLNLPVYVNWLAPGEVVYQYVRKPGLDIDSRMGRWFALRGASMDALGIFGGLSGRQLVEFQVLADVEVLEGTAAPMVRDWSWAGGGGGGATQMFVPQGCLHAFRYVGPPS